jgi:hypothetical protein
MSCLVAELKADHVTLKHILKEAGDLTKSALERVEILSRAKGALLSHLDKETESFIRRSNRWLPMIGRPQPF